MVAIDTISAWDLKPNRENANQLFNVLCNVIPTPHPRTGNGYRKNVDVIASEKQQYWFEKCKGLKRAKLYEYACRDGVSLVESRYKKREDKIWVNSNFTDVTLFQGYRLFLRKSDVVLSPYVGDGNENTCDNGQRPSEQLGVVTEENTEGRFNEVHTKSGRTRVYIQQVEQQSCSGETFDDIDQSPIVLVKEYASSSCNPDRFVRGYGGIGVPRIICNPQEKFKIAMINYGGTLFAYLYVDKGNFSISPSEYVYLQDQGIYLSGLTKVNKDTIAILTNVELPVEGYFIPQVAELTHLFKVPQKGKDNDGVEITELNANLKCFSKYGEVPYLAVGNSLYSINGFFYGPEGECSCPEECRIDDYIYQKNGEIVPCETTPVKQQKRRIFLFDQLISASTNRYSISGFSSRGTRLAYIANGALYISGTGTMQGVFGADLTARGDLVRGYKSIPAGLTDAREMYGSLLLFGPKAIYAIKDENAAIAGMYLRASDVEDGYYSPGAYFNDDGEYLIVRKNKVLETMEYSPYYGTIKFTPDTGFFVNSHFKGCNPAYDNISVDASINHRYISIYDNNHVNFEVDGEGKVKKNTHYSKLLIYDKHYNVWYHWMITGARITRVKDGIFLGDGVYSNKGRTRGWEDDDREGGEIIQIISAYVGEEGLQTPKHIQYVKTAIGNHSVITKQSVWTYETSLGGRQYIRRVPIISTRQAQLLEKKDRNGIIKTYDSDQKIYSNGEKKPHTLMSEMQRYQNYDELSVPIRRDSITDDTILASFASIKEALNIPANIIELTIASRGLDNVQFGSFYISYYLSDADYEDIENTNITITDFSDNVFDLELNKGEFCEDILRGSACDGAEEDTILNP